MRRYSRLNRPIGQPFTSDEWLELINDAVLLHVQNRPLQEAINNLVEDILDAVEEDEESN